MEETNEKVRNLNNFIERRSELLSFLKQKEDIQNLSQNNDDNLSEEFEKALNECVECDSKIKEYKAELEPRFFIKFEESEYTNNSQETALVLKTENKIVNWFKNKIKEFKFNYAIERALKRDIFIEENISSQISSYSAYLNVIKANGNKAIFKKYMNNVANVNSKNLSDNKI